jgi:flagellar hook-length control protein FliK
MIPKIDPKLNLLSEIREPNAVTASDISKRDVNSKLSQIVIGKELLGEVLGKRADGTYLVKVANLTFKIDLPNPAQLGERLHLTPLTLFPKTSFLLNENSDHPFTLLGQLNVAEDAELEISAKILNRSQEINSSKLAEFRAQTITTTTQELPEQSSPTHLSNASQLISHLLTESTELNRAETIKSSALIGLGALAALNQPVTTNELAHKLQQAVEKSGLFYESHVAQWSRGQLPLTQIQEEAKLLSVELPKIFPTQLQELPAGMAEILRQQLHFIEHQNITWQGMLNPETPMSWRIEEQEHKQKEQEEQTSELPPSTWLSQLQVDFPHLGKVKIQLQLHENNLQANFQVAESDQLTSLRLGLPELKKNLLDAQIQLIQSHVLQAPIHHTTEISKQKST